MKSKRGFTLIELLISLTVFTIFFLSAITLYSQGLARASEQKAYTYLESICLDIDKYYDKFDLDWDSEYYGEHNVNGSTIYLDSEFKKTTADDCAYYLEYKYVEGNLVVNAKLYSTNKFIIEELEYGQSKAR